MSRRVRCSCGLVWELAAGPSEHESAVTTCPRCGHVWELAAGPSICNLEILEEISLGGEAVVYKARDLHIDRVLALKLLRGTSSLLQRRFLRASQCMAAVSHPGIVALHEFNEYEKRAYQVMEFCAGGDLEQKLRSGPLPVEEATRLIEAVARAVHAVHAVGLVHRDIHPTHVLFTAQGEPKLTGFSLARAADGGQPAASVLVGTPQYLPPEQVSGTGVVDRSIDVYALGVLLYVCLTGRPPFQGTTTLETLTQIVEQEPTPPRQLRPEVPQRLSDICLRCLQKDPRLRPATALELADALRIGPAAG
jgi:serine/threonine-protein kinase